MSFLVLGTGIGVGWPVGETNPPPPLPIESPVIHVGTGRLGLDGGAGFSWDDEIHWGGLPFGWGGMYIPIFLVVSSGSVSLGNEAVVLQIGTDIGLDWGADGLDWGAAEIEWA